MDIRVAAYRPVTVQTFNTSRNTTVAVSDARAGGPVSPVNPISGRASLRELAGQQNQGLPFRSASADGYTDAIRGSNINILA